TCALPIALIWGVAKDKDAGPMAEARKRAIDATCDEYRRLLYVGLTRAEDRLVICGAKGVNKAPGGCWHDLVLSALQPLSEEAIGYGGRRAAPYHRRRRPRVGTVTRLAGSPVAAIAPGYPRRAAPEGGRRL